MHLLKDMKNSVCEDFLLPLYSLACVCIGGPFVEMNVGWDEWVSNSGKCSTPRACIEEPLVAIDVVWLG